VWWEVTVSGTEDGQKHHYSMTFLDFTKKNNNKKTTTTTMYFCFTQQKLF